MTIPQRFPAAVPEIPVAAIDTAIEYYRSRLGFDFDWGGAEGGIAQVSRGDCRLFLTDAAFRAGRGNGTPVVIWLNLDSRDEVDALFEAWSLAQATIVSRPESMPWKLHEFTASDLDGNLLRVFYDFSRDGD